MMTDEERGYYIGFSVFPGIGPVRFKLLTDYFGSAQKAWNAPEKELEAVNLPQNLRIEFLKFRNTFNIAEYQTQLSCLHVNTLTWADEKYPRLLKEITDAPFVLYVKSKPHTERIDMERTIAVVGTRKATNYGIDATKRLVTDLVSYGFTIISGMAYGIDAVAHETAIAAGGKTIAVLGCGVDLIAPSTNAHIYRQLTEDGFGAVISEMPLSLRPNKGLFPARNRIISGLSLGVLVTEGANDSGALITASNAATQGRDVFAVPGPITSEYSRGPAKLIKNGAVLVETVEDIMQALGVEKHHTSVHNKKTLINVNLSDEEKKIAEIIANVPLSMDDIVCASRMTASAVSATITLLEMKGIVRDYGERVYGLV